MCWGTPRVWEAGPRVSGHGGGLPEPRGACQSDTPWWAGPIGKNVRDGRHWTARDGHYRVSRVVTRASRNLPRMRYGPATGGTPRVKNIDSESPQLGPGEGGHGHQLGIGGGQLVPDGREPMRHVRVSDELWTAAQEAVKQNGDPSVSAIIREALAAYVRAAQREAARQRAARNRGANLDPPRPGRKRPPPR